MALTLISALDRELVLRCVRGFRRRAKMQTAVLASAQVDKNMNVAFKKCGDELSPVGQTGL